MPLAEHHWIAKSSSSLEAFHGKAWPGIMGAPTRLCRSILAVSDVRDVLTCSVNDTYATWNRAEKCSY